VTKGNKKSKAIYRRIQLLPEEQKLYRTANGQANAQLNSREALDIYFGRFHYKITISSELQLYSSSSGLVDKDSILYSNYREDISRRFS